MLPAWFGSLGSFVASTLVPLRLPVAGGSTFAAEQLSVLGAAADEEPATASAATSVSTIAPKRQKGPLPLTPLVKGEADGGNNPSFEVFSRCRGRCRRTCRPRPAGTASRSRP